MYTCYVRKIVNVLFIGEIDEKVKEGGFNVQGHFSFVDIYVYIGSLHIILSERWNEKNHFKII